MLLAHGIRTWIKTLSPSCKLLKINAFGFVYDTMQATGVIWVPLSWKNSGGLNFRHRKVSYTISDAELPVDSKNAIKNTPLVSSKLTKYLKKWQKIAIFRCQIFSNYVFKIAYFLEKRSYASNFCFKWKIQTKAFI